jgi:hypothetical protein
MISFFPIELTSFFASRTVGNLYSSFKIIAVRYTLSAEPFFPSKPDEKTLLTQAWKDLNYTYLASPQSPEQSLRNCEDF